MRPALPTGAYILGTGPTGNQSKAVVYTGSTPCDCCGGTPTTCCCDPYGVGTGSGYEYGQPNTTNLAISQLSQSGGVIDWLSGDYTLGVLDGAPCGAWQFIGNVANTSDYCAFADNVGFPNHGHPTIIIQAVCFPGLTAPPSCNGMFLFMEFDGGFGGQVGASPLLLPTTFPPCVCSPLLIIWRFSLSTSTILGGSGPCPSDLPGSGWFINYQAQLTI